MKERYIQVSQIAKIRCILSIYTVMLAICETRGIDVSLQLRELLRLISHFCFYCQALILHECMS